MATIKYLDDTGLARVKTNLDTKFATKQDVVQYSSMPTADSTTVGKIVQYIGTTNANYTNGYFYIGIDNSGSYSWSNINVQDSGGSSIPQLKFSISKAYNKNDIKLTFDNDSKAIVKEYLKEYKTNGTEIPVFLIKSSNSYNPSSSNETYYTGYMRFGYNQYSTNNYFFYIHADGQTPSGYSSNNKVVHIDTSATIIYDATNDTLNFYDVYCFLYKTGTAYDIDTLYNTGSSANTMDYYKKLAFLTVANTKEYTPTGDYNPATKKYVDDSTANFVSKDDYLGNIKVDSISPKNLIDVSSVENDTINDIELTNNDDGSITLDGTASANTSFTYELATPITLKNGVTYTYSLNALNKPDRNDANVNLRDESNNMIISLGANQDSTTYTPDSDITLKYIRFYVTSGTTLEDFTPFPQLELGDTQTTYAKRIDYTTKEYVDESIASIPTSEIPQQDTAPLNPSEDDLWIDTSQDNLMTTDSQVSTTSTNPVQNQAITNYVNNAVLERYSPTETMIGYWNNNKPLYRKVLSLALPTAENTWTTITTIADIDQLVNVGGAISGYIPIPFYLTANYNCNFQKNGNDIQVYTKGYPNAYTRVILEYTKTTD